MWPKQDIEAMNAFYGNPDMNADGLPDSKFEAANLVRVLPPYPMVMSWNLKPLSRITIHRKCAESLLIALRQIGHEFNDKERARYQLDRYGGGYNFRLKRGGNRLSIHSWGAAIDLAPDLNPLGRVHAQYPNMMPARAVAAFAAQGWEWGGLWKRPDAMHFQSAGV